MSLMYTARRQPRGGPSGIAFFITMVVAVAGCGAFASGESGSSRNTLDLRIAATQGQGDSVCVEARLCNNGSTTMQIVPLLIPQDYFIAFEVLDHTGQQVSFVGPERRVIVPDKAPLEPGACFTERCGLKSLFAIPASGVLTVKARYWDDLIHPQDSKVRLDSNVLEIDAARLGTSKSCTATEPRP